MKPKQRYRKSKCVEDFATTCLSFTSYWLSTDCLLSRLSMKWWVLGKGENGFLMVDKGWRERVQVCTVTMVTHKVSLIKLCGLKQVSLCGGRFHVQSLAAVHRLAQQECYLHVLFGTASLSILWSMSACHASGDSHANLCAKMSHSFFLSSF